MSKHLKQKVSVEVKHCPRWVLPACLSDGKRRVRAYRRSDGEYTADLTESKNLSE